MVNIINQMGPDGNEFFKDVEVLLRKHQGKMPNEYLLAISAKIVGRIMMIQDRRRFSYDQLIGLINENMRIGMKDVSDLNAQSLSAKRLIM